MTGEIGSGPRALDSAYWIDAYSAYLGCTNPGPDNCSIMVKGYQNWSTFSVITQGLTQAPCPGMKNCSLALVDFADGFRNLTGLQIIATVGTKSAFHLSITLLVRYQALDHSTCALSSISNTPTVTIHIALLYSSYIL